MKSIQHHFAPIVFTSLCLTACSGGFYQVMEASHVPDEDGMGLDAQTGRIVFENEEVRVVYNLWANGGTMSFMIANKTDAPLYIDWGKSHLIHNGLSYDYWEDVEQTTSFYASGSSWYGVGSSRTTSSPGRSSMSSVAASSAVKNTVSSSHKHKPKRVVEIPPNSALSVSKFELISEPYYNCDFNWATVNQSKEPRLNFDISTTPLAIRNYITYSATDGFEDTKVIDNGFYVNAIEFFSERRFKGPLNSISTCSVWGYKVSSTAYEYPFKNGRSFYFRMGVK